MQTVQYQIRQRAQPGNTHLERTKALFKSDHNIVPPALLQRYLPYMIKFKSRRKKCNNRVVWKYNLRKQILKQKSFLEEWQEYCSIYADSKISSPAWQNVIPNANSAILDLSKSTTWGHLKIETKRLSQQSGQIIAPPRLLQMYLPVYVKFNS